MDTLLKFRWLIALILIIGAMIYFNERQSKKGIPPELVDSLLKWQEQKTGLLIDLARAQVADSLLRGQITDYVNAEKPILNTYEKYKKEYSTKTPSETDAEFLNWIKKNKYD